MPSKDERRRLREEMKANSPDYFSVPRDLFWDDELSALEQRLLMFIAHKDQGPRGCFASNTYLAAFANCHENTIKTAIRKFVERGFLFEVPWDGIERRLYVNGQYRSLLKGEYPRKGRTKTVRPLDNNVRPLDKNCAAPGQSLSVNMDESSERVIYEELSEGNGVAHNAPDPEPTAEEVAWAMERLKAKHVPIKDPENPASRAVIREEVARLRRVPVGDTET